MVITPLLLAGCSGPFSALDPAGPSASAVAALWWGMFAAATVVLVSVVGLWLYAVGRSQRELRDEKPDSEESDSEGLNSEKPNSKKLGNERFSDEEASRIHRRW